jgi:hypothetical protein
VTRQGCRTVAAEQAREEDDRILQGQIGSEIDRTTSFIVTESLLAALPLAIRDKEWFRAGREIKSACGIIRSTCCEGAGGEEHVSVTAATNSNRTHITLVTVETTPRGKGICGIASQNCAFGEISAGGDVKSINSTTRGRGVAVGEVRVRNRELANVTDVNRSSRRGSGSALNERAFSKGECCEGAQLAGEGRAIE